MKEIEFDTTKTMILDLKDLQLGSITIKEIEAENFDMLNQIFQIKTTYKDREYQAPLVLSAYLNSMSRDPKVELDYKIEDSDNSVIEAKHDLKTKYIIRYETLADKIKRIKANKEVHQMDIQKKVERWQCSINNLYSEIEKWVIPIKDEIMITRKKKLILEEQTEDAYPVEQLNLTLFNGRIIIFNPIGTFIIGGSKGRIDITITGRFQDSIMLILHRKDEVDNWTIIKNRDLQNVKELNKGQLFNLIENVI